MLWLIESAIRWAQQSRCHTARGPNRILDLFDFVRRLRISEFGKLRMIPSVVPHLVPFSDEPSNQLDATRFPIPERNAKKACKRDFVEKRTTTETELLSPNSVNPICCVQYLTG